MKKRRKTPPEYLRAFLRRTQVVREGAGYTQTTMAEKLGLEERDSYAKYETRTPLPHDLIPRFCEATKTDPWFLLTGQSHATNPGR